MTVDELARAAAGGDEAAFEELVRLHEKKYTIWPCACAAVRRTPPTRPRTLSSPPGRACPTSGGSGLLHLALPSDQQRGHRPSPPDQAPAGRPVWTTSPSGWMPWTAPPLPRPRPRGGAAHGGTGGPCPAQRGPPSGADPPGASGAELRGDLGGAGGGSGDGEVPDLPGQGRAAKNPSEKREPIRLSAV